MSESFDDQVRGALSDQAGRIQPTDRLAAIQAAARESDPEATAVISETPGAQARSASPTGPGAAMGSAGAAGLAGPTGPAARPPGSETTTDEHLATVVPLRRRALGRTLGWVAVAAVTVLVAGVAIGGLLGRQPSGATAGAQPEARDTAVAKATQMGGQSVTAPAPGTAPASGTAPPTRVAPSSAPGTVRAEPWAMPLYYPATGTSAKPWLLVRDFVTTSASVDRADRVQLTVNALVSGTANGEPLLYETMQRPWRPGTTAQTTVTPTEITVTLSQPLVDGLTPEQARVAGQAIAWTATAAAQQTVPVRLQVGSAAPTVVSRPETGQEWNDLAPIWVVTPARLAQVGAARPIDVSGEACTFEGAYAWQVLQGEGVVRSGTGQATSGCPARGTFTFQVPGLQAGAYTLRVFETSAADGGVAYEAKVPLIVA